MVDLQKLNFVNNMTATRHLEIQSKLTSQLLKRFVAAVIDNPRARFHTTLLLYCKFLDARFWPVSEDEKIIYGHKEVKEVANFLISIKC